MSVSYCLSQIFLLEVFYQTIDSLGIVNALTATSIGLFLACALCGLMIRFPNETNVHIIGRGSSDGDSEELVKSPLKDSATTEKNKKSCLSDGNDEENCGETGNDEQLQSGVGMKDMLPWY